jgi:hypothetical protein
MNYIKKEKNVEPFLICIDDLYEDYKKYKFFKKVFLIVSKNFFEKFIKNKIVEYIKYDKFVSSEWLNKEK